MNTATFHAEINSKARDIVATLTQLDLGDIAMSDALMAAVMTGDRALMGEVLGTLIDSFGKRVAERVIFGDTSIDGEAEAMRLVTASVVNRPRRAA